MAQKINPFVFRLGGLYTWVSRWFAGEKDFKRFLLEDVKLRRAIMEKLKNAGVAKVEIERSINKIEVTIHSAKPGMVIGRGGSGLEDLKKFILQTLKINPLLKTAPKVELNAIEPIKEMNLNAYLVAQNIAEQLCKRMKARRVIKMMVDKVMGSGAKGVKIRLSGRVDGAEICKVEKGGAGSVPLTTMRADIDFARYPAATRSGYVGIKVWIYKN